MAQIMNSLLQKYRLKLKKVGKITRPFRYDLNQIPYDYTVEATNRFKRVGKITRPFRYDLNLIPYDYTVGVTNRCMGLDLIRVPDELWTEVRDIVQETGIKTIPMEKKCKKAKWLSGEALQIGSG